MAGSDFTFGSLFAGIGGMDLGLERAGMKCVWQVEIDDYCQRVLAKHWPDVRRHNDVRTFPPTEADEWRCDLIAGGFPCQDISNAGKRAGIDGERSGLWSEFARIIRVVRPRYVLVENVAALTSRGLDRVLGNLASLGYDAEWDCLQAKEFRLPHRRSRLFIVAYSAQKLGDGHEVFQRAERPTTATESAEWLSKWTRRRVVDGQGNRRTRCVPVGGLREDDDGLPLRVHALGALGNAVVPSVAEFVGRRILEIERGGQ